MKVLKNRWPDTSVAESVKFFAQAMYGFLDVESHEGFRAYCLDTLGRIREAISLAVDIKSGKVNRAALDVVLAEVVWSATTDNAARSCAGETLDLLVSMCANKSCNIDDFIHLSRKCERLLADGYHEEIKNWVVRSIDVENSKISLLQSVGFLVSHLLTEGYSRHFLIDRVEERFFKHEVMRASARMVSSFIDGIARERRDYVVLVRAPSATVNILSLVGGWSLRTVASLPSHARTEVTNWGLAQDGLVIAEKVSAVDPYQAAMAVENRLSEIEALLMFGPHPTKLEWPGRAYVFTPRSTSGVQLENAGSTLYTLGNTEVHGRRLKILVALPKAISKHLDASSAERVQNAISTASVFSKTHVEEAKLISLWSAFEVLLGDPAEGPRISHYSKYVPPMVCYRYHRRLFSAVYDQLYVEYKKKFTKIMREMNTEEANQHTKFAKLIMLPDYEAQRASLISMCSDNPLARHRLFRLQKYWGSPSMFGKTMIDHFNRVSWQLQRIYRERNNLVHSGRSPVYLESIILNTFEYMQSSITAIVRRSKDTGVGNVDQIIAELGFEWTLMVKRMSGFGAEASFDEALVERIFSP